METPILDTHIIVIIIFMMMMIIIITIIIINIYKNCYYY